MNQNAEHNISEGEQSIIHDSIAQKVDGRFEFTLLREAESDSMSDSD